MSSVSKELQSTQEWLVCVTCGTQFPTPDRSAVKTCHICDDPRQYVPATGQSFTTLAHLRTNHTNEFQPLSAGASGVQLISIHTQPRLAIGQRAILIQTPGGNILWDCLTLLDDATISAVAALGGLAGIVISHPHFYSAHADWAAAFNCPVYLSAEDREWVSVPCPQRVFLDNVETAIPGKDGAETGVVAIKLGGHFPGSLVVLVGGRLLTADTLMLTPAGRGDWKVNAVGEVRKRPEGLNTFCFMFSYPNSIPLGPDELARMWGILKGYEFRAVHGGFVGMDLDDDDMKTRVLESMMIQTIHMGWLNHKLLAEKL